MSYDDVTIEAAESSAWELDREFFSDIQKRAAYNEAQAEYYRRMGVECHDELAFDLKAEPAETCSKVWDLDVYHKHGLKQVIGINRCHDSFCYVCQSIKALRRFQVYAPVLQLYEEDFDIYHIVFTVPNVDGRSLAITLDKMTNCFARIIRYFEGSKKIKGFDFENFGYGGAVRSLEITTGAKKDGCRGNDFHPHFHCMFLLRKGIDLPHEIYNSFSNDRDHSKGTYLFSRLEVLLQRIFCLLMLNIKVTKDNIIDIESLTNGRYKDGFSIRAYNVNHRFRNGVWESLPDGPGKFHEIFKYAIKGTYKKESIFSYDEFCCLYNALKNRRVYQTYGLLQKHNFEEIDDIFTPQMATDALFEKFLRVLQTREKPFRTQTALDDILSDLSVNGKRKKKVRYFGPAGLRALFKDKTEEELQECIVTWLNELNQ